MATARVVMLRASSRPHGIFRRVDARPARFVLVGLTGVGISTGVLWVATRELGLSTLWGGVLASVISTLTNFLLNDAFTWRDRRVPGWWSKATRIARYYATTIGGNLIYLGALTMLVQWVHVFDLLANLVAIGVGGTFNYVLHNLWTWGRTREA